MNLMSVYAFLIDWCGRGPRAIEELAKKPPPFVITRYRLAATPFGYFVVQFMQRFGSFFLVLLLSLSAVWSCSRTKDLEKVAEVDGQIITRAEIDRSGGKQLQNLRRQLYQLERQKLSEYIGATLLSREAKDQGVSVSTLLDQEVNTKVPAVSEEDIRAFYEMNKARIGVELDKVHDQIRDYLLEQKTTARKNEYFKILRSKAKVTTYLKAPPIQRADVSIKGAPFKGEEKAPVTIVKFEDFECPFCRNVQPTLAAVLKRYDGKVRVVHKDLPLEQIHPQAQLAAEAARCAGDQGKFWEYHDLLYANAPKLASAELRSYAKQVGLTAPPFEQCLGSGKYKAAVQKDLSEGASLGLTGTPSFFINGREISGALPVESFAAIIDEELGQAN
jgi:protein-disulfide isomerase